MDRHTSEMKAGLMVDHVEMKVGLMVGHLVADTVGLMACCIAAQMRLTVGQVHLMVGDMMSGKVDLMVVDSMTSKGVVTPVHMMAENVGLVGGMLAENLVGLHAVY